MKEISLTYGKCGAIRFFGEENEVTNGASTAPRIPITKPEQVLALILSSAIRPHEMGGKARTQLLAEPRGQTAAILRSSAPTFDSAEAGTNTRSPGFVEKS